MICPYSRNASPGVSCNKSCARYDDTCKQCIDVTQTQALVATSKILRKILAQLFTPTTVFQTGESVEVVISDDEEVSEEDGNDP